MNQQLSLGHSPDLTRSQREYYEEKYGTDWSGRAASNSRFTKVWYRAVVQHCAPRLRLDGRRVLEVGCGIGLLGEFFAQQGATYVGVDLAAAAVSQFPSGDGLKCFPAVADACFLPFPNASFDIVLCMEVLEHAPDPNPLADECFRVVRPRGSLIFSCPNYFGLLVLPKILAELGIPFFRRYIGRQFVDRWTTSFELRRLLANKGTVLVQRAVRLHPPFFEELDHRLSETNPLRRINDWIFAVENYWGDRFPLRYIGQHTLCLAQAPSKILTKAST